MSRFVVVGGYMEAEPRSACTHVSFERLPLRLSLRKSVEPHHQAVLLQMAVIQILQVRGCIESKVIFLCKRCVEPQRVEGEQHVVRLDVQRVKEQDLWARCFRALRLGTSAAGQQHACAQ